MRALISTIALCLAATAANADDVDVLVRSEMQSRSIPGLSLAVIHDGKVIKAAGYGLANVELNVPASRRTIYQSGSLGKSFTAAAVMKLVEAGKVQLDAPIATYFPEAPQSWAKVTVRHLLNHTASIPRDFFAGKPNLREDLSDGQMLREIFALDVTLEPGYAVHYSNAGYVLLGLLIARVSGKSYEEYLREAIFTPAAMTTARVIDEQEIIPDRAAGYELLEGKLRNQRWVAPSHNRTGDGGLYFSLNDLIAWDAALWSGSLLHKQCMQEMLSPVHTGSGTISEYGFGWALDGIKGHARFHHSGGWQGFSTAYQHYPDDRLTVIVLTNLGPPHAKPSEIAEAVAKKYFAKEAEAGTAGAGRVSGNAR